MAKDLHAMVSGTDDIEFHFLGFLCTDTNKSFLRHLLAWGSILKKEKNVINLKNEGEARKQIIW